MAYKSYTKEGMRRIHTKENNSANTLTMTEAMAELSLRNRSIVAAGTHNRNTCGLERTDETSLKSCDPTDMLDAAPTLAQESLPHIRTARTLAQEADIDRRQQQVATESGVLSAQTRIQAASNSTQYDVALNSRSVVEPVNTAGTSTVEDHNFSSMTSNSTHFPADQRSSHAGPMGMNIPPSLPEQRINNTEIPFAIAEQQPSFRSTTTVSSDLPSISGARGTLQSQQAQQQNQNYLVQNFQNFPSESAYSNFYMDSSHLTRLPFMSSEDNNNIMPGFPVLNHQIMTARPLKMDAYLYGLQNGAAGFDQGRPLSHSSSCSSMKSFIPDDCLVKKMSWKILNHVAQHLECKFSSATWKDLVENYGWDYERTFLFENKKHQDGIFFSLLREPEFQNYTLDQLREDLFRLPRKDILSDLNRMVANHNANSVGGGGK